ncbi:type VI secretion protein [Klebsiella pneumoniae]|nr:type VI secretion protein [Klebsiella pneumoniae]
MVRKTGLYRKEKKSTSIKNNFNSVLSEFSPEVNLSVPNTLAGNGEEENVRLRFTDIKDFETGAGCPANSATPCHAGDA